MRNVFTLTLLTAATSFTSSTLAQTAPAAVTPVPIQKDATQFIELQPLSSTRVLKFDAPKWVIDPAKAYRVVLETTKGKMTVELYPQVAPKTVNSFVFLALNNYYNGVPFHRVLENFMAQTGDPTGTGSGGPGYKFGDEIVSELRHRGKGVLSMANAGPGPGGTGTNGSQIFITFSDTPHLDGKHTVFGKVVEGLETLDKIKRNDPSRPLPYPSIIERAYVLEK